MAAVTIRFDADPSDALDGTQQVGDALGDLGDQLGDAGDAGAESADQLAGSYQDAAAEIEDSAAASAEAVDEVSASSEGAGLNVRALGKIGKEAMEGDLAGAANAARPLLAGLGPAAAIAGGVAVGAIGLISTAIKGMGTDAERVQQIASDAFKKMAQDGVDAWETAAAQNRRLTDAYTDHEGEIQKIADLTGLTFEDVAAAWAGNADAVALVNRAAAEMNSELRKTPSVSVEAASATIAGWEGVLAPLNDTIKGYDQAAEKAGRLAEQQSKMLLGIVADAGSASVEVDELGNKLFTLSDGTKVIVDADTGLASQHIDKFKGDLDGVPEKVSTTLVVDRSEAERDVDAFVASVQRRRITVRVRGVDDYGRSIK